LATPTEMPQAGSGPIIGCSDPWRRIPATRFVPRQGRSCSNRRHVIRTDIGCKIWPGTVKHMMSWNICITFREPKRRQASCVVGCKTDAQHGTTSVPEQQVASKSYLPSEERKNFISQSFAKFWYWYGDSSLKTWTSLWIDPSLFQIFGKYAKCSWRNFKFFLKFRPRNPVYVFENCTETTQGSRPWHLLAYYVVSGFNGIHYHRVALFEAAWISEFPFSRSWHSRRCFTTRREGYPCPHIQILEARILSLSLSQHCVFTCS
jgi:hypothetical protein